MRPFVKTHGVVFFKKNAVVSLLLDESQKRGYGLNELPLDKFSQADIEEFYQLIGYSLSGYHELTLVSDLAALEASKVARSKFPGASGCRDNGCEIHSGVEREEEP